MRQRGNRVGPRGVVVAAMSGVLLSTAFLPAPASAGTGETVPPNTITRLSTTLPNVYFQDHSRPDSIASPNTVVLTDPANNLIIEFNAYSCPDLGVYDGDTYALKALDRTRCPIGSADSGSSSKVPVAAIDPRDHLLFFAPPGGQILGVSETTLATIVQFTPPSLLSGSLTGSIAGLSWDSRSDELVVSGVEPQSVSAYDVPAMLRAAAAEAVPAPLWNVALTSCGQPTLPQFTTQAAYMAADDSAAFVLCELTESVPLGATNTNREGMIKVGMAAATPSNPCAAGAPFCPDGQLSTAVAPGVAVDLIFDAPSERGFLPSQGQHGTQLLVYDGKLGAFAGRSNVGDVADANSGIFNLDPSTGRLYALFPSSGLTVIDGRRTPVSPGSVYQSLAGVVNYVSGGTLPPDAQHRFTRVFVPFQHCDSTGNNCAVPNVTVLADTLAVTQDPPQGSVDSGTNSGPIPPGSVVSSIYGSTARGYGFHLDYVGGPGGSINNLTFGGSNGGQSGRPDVLGGVIQNLNLRTQGAIGDASALADGNGTTAGAVPASQPWPYADSTCASPGPASQGHSSNTGAVTASGSGTQPVPGSDNSDAYSSVTCTGPVTAEARYGATHATGSGLPTVEVGSSSTTSSVTAPTAANVIGATVTALAHGVTIDLGPTASISFGTVSQVVTSKAGGRPGTAGATSVVSLSNVSITQNGQTTELCAGLCAGDPQGVISAINTAFPTLLEVTMPDVDGRYVHGSPGGYLAAVQANLPEQYGDQQFNGMSAEEATFHPGLRIVMYGFNDGTPTLSREVLDLAGAEVDSELGLNVLPPPTSTDVATLTEQQVQQAAGLVTSYSGGSAGTPGTPGHAGTTVATANLGTFAQQVFNGLQSLLRTPLGALKMLGFLGLLGLPIVMMRRRWTWLTEPAVTGA